MATNFKRIQITLKPDVVAELDKMAEEWGTSRSGMITILTKLRRDYEKSIYENDIDERLLRDSVKRGEFD